MDNSNFFDVKFQRHLAHPFIPGKDAGIGKGVVPTPPSPNLAEKFQHHGWLNPDGTRE